MAQIKAAIQALYKLRDETNIEINLIIDKLERSIDDGLERSIDDGLEQSIDGPSWLPPDDNRVWSHQVPNKEWAEAMYAKTRSGAESPSYDFFES